MRFPEIGSISELHSRHGQEEFGTVAEQIIWLKPPLISPELFGSIPIIQFQSNSPLPMSEIPRSSVFCSASKHISIVCFFLLPR